ncbi:MAG TPA: hypothetical protein PLV22_08340 [Candidatus Cloacimonadota bacterium]|nr:hypothetical protein [Candidatus Cloacimonadota bacterium]
MKKILYIIICMFCYTLSAVSLPVTLIKPDTLHIGQSFNLEVKVHNDKTSKIIAPKRINADNIALLKVNQEEVEELYKYLLTVAVFDTGKVNFPPISFYRQKGNKIDSLTTETFSIWVSSSLTPADSLIKDIKPISKIKLKIQDYALIVLIVIVIIFIVIILKKLMKKKELNIISEYIDTRAAWEKAYAMLEELKLKDLLEKNEWIEYHYLLSLILRYFLMYQFNFKAVEMTTYEIKESMPKDIHARDEILQLLRFCDQIKFAKGVPDISISKQSERWLEGYILSFKEEIKEDHE